MKAILGLFAIGTCAAAVYGWVANIFKMIACIPEGFTAELVVRIIGIPVAIIGMIYGWF